MKRALAIVVFVYASAALLAHAGNSVNVKEEVSSIISLDQIYVGKVIIKVKRGEKVSDRACVVIASEKEGEMSVKVLDIVSADIKYGPKEEITFVSKVDGSELASEPKTTAGEGFRELNMQTIGEKSVQGLSIRAIEGGAIVRVSERLMGDFDLPEKSLACSID